MNQQTIYIKNKHGIVFQLEKSKADALIKKGLAISVTEEKPLYIQGQRRSLPARIVTTPYGFDGYGKISRWLTNEFETPISADIKVFLGIPGEHIKDNKNSFHVLLTMFEADKIPKEWVKYCNHADFIITPSQFCVETFKKCGVKTPMVKLNLAADSNDIITPPTEPFIFAHQNAFLKDKRKGWDLVVKAFLDAFEGDMRVKLILKGREHGISNDKKFMEDLRKHKNIEMIEKEYTPEQMRQLFWNRTNCFVFPSRGEGFSLPPLEAMAHGIPTILTNGHSHTEFVKYGIPIEIDGPAEPDYSIHNGIPSVPGKWVEPSLQDLEGAMVDVYHNYEEYKKEAIEKAHAIKINFSLKKFLNGFERIILDLYEKR